MKKFLMMAALSLSFALPVSAASGDVAGKIYSTDIRAYINGVEVKSYNIGGKTAIVIEDILAGSHQFIYSDYYRTLKVFSLAPASLVEGKNESSLKPGEVVGNIYETDIKTSIYDVGLPAYNIGGKTALVIEDLGKDGEFSEIGGRYKWNDGERTISLEFMYQNSSLIPDDMNIHITANENITEATGEFREIFHCQGGNEHFTWPEGVNDNSDIKTVMPINVQGETIGYYIRRPSEDYKFMAFSYYLPDKVKEVSEKYYTPHPTMSRNDIIEHFRQHDGGGSPEVLLEAKDYTLVQTTFALTKDCMYSIVQAFDDGTYVNYMNDIHDSQRLIRDLTVDKENEKVEFTYMERHTPKESIRYEIDLKDKTITEIK